MKTKRIPTAISIAPCNIQPKPTKSEIIEAMLARAKFKHDAENERRKTKRETIRKKIEAVTLKIAKSMTPSVHIYAYSDTRASHCDVKIDRIKSPELDVLLDEFKTNELQGWAEKETRESIRRMLNGTVKSNPARLLENPEAVAAIDDKLQRWGI
jgi:hypothetical protein